jgi:DNA modification methylase
VTQTQRWPAETIERRAVADLIPYARNARTHSQEQVAEIAASIQRFGWTVPVLVAEDGTIIAGHGRVMAAGLLGIQEVPAMIARGWTDEQRRAYTLADNRIAENSAWDKELLRIEVGELNELGVDLTGLGFSDSELIGLVVGDEGTAGADDEPDPIDDPVSVLGDLWILGRHRILCGDCTDAAAVARLLAGERPGLMVTDPPYGVEYDPAWRAAAGVNKNRSKMGEVANDDRADWRDAWALFPGDVAYVWHAGLYSSVVTASLEAVGFDVRSQIIWAKDRFALSRGDYHWRHEPCLYAVRHGRTSAWAGDRSQSTLWEIPAREDKGLGHSTQKPVECMRRPIENNSQPGDGVYEPFSGSGTTIIAGEQTGRAVFAMEINPVYVDIAVRRWEAVTGKRAVRERDGLSFAQALAAAPD